MPHSSARSLAAALSVATLLLAGCGSSRDSALSEKLARAERAADRAEAAQREAERAAKTAKDKVNQFNAADAGDDVPIESDGEDEETVDTAGAEIAPADPA